MQELEAQESLPTNLASDFLKSEEETHVATVKAEADRKQKVKEEEERLLALKKEEKQRRKEAREAKRRAEELAALRTEIEGSFIAKGTSVPEIQMQEVYEINGNEEDKPVVGVLGGLLGQIILTISIMEKNFNRQLTSKSTKSKKSAKSSKSSKKAEEEKKKEEEEAKSHKSQNEGEKSQKEGEGDPGFAEGMTPHEILLKEKGWFTKQNIQNFLHTFI